jgi:hypothetical protein
MHLDDGQLIAFLDHALAAPERAGIANHLAICDECRHREQELAARGERIAAHLTALSPLPISTNAQAALRHFHTRYDLERKETSVFNQILSKRFRLVGIALAAILMVVIAFSFEPVQALAGQLLGLFRVQEITVLPIDTTGLSQLNGNSPLADQISQLFSKSLQFTKKPGAPHVAASAAEAGKLAGFNVRLPSSRTDTPQLQVQGGTAFRFVVDRARAQAILDESGHANLKLPASLDGANIVADIPAGVTAAYGDCPQPEQQGGSSANQEYNKAIKETQRTTNASGSPGRRYANCVILTELPSPTVTTPPDVNLAQLAEIGLEFSGMTPEQARAYSQTVDWTSTLVIPIPRNAASYKEVTVDGVKGYLIQRPPDDAPQYGLVWVKAGIIYAIGGLGSDTAGAMAMANSLR